LVKRKRWVWITIGLTLFSAFVLLLAATSGPSMPPELQFLYNFDNDPQQGELESVRFTGGIHGPAIDSYTVYVFDGPGDVGALSSSIARAVETNPAWKFVAYTPQTKQIRYIKHLASGGKHLEVSTSSGGGQWATVQVIDWTYKTPGWRRWLRGPWKRGPLTALHDQPRL
jgi:hypothetical protein